MNISYKWLREYVEVNLTAEEVAAALTSIGLEVGSVEEVQSIKGGLEGLWTGQVLTCEEHPNSDHMHVCTVNVGQGEPLQIVCGAPLPDEFAEGVDEELGAGFKEIVSHLGKAPGADGEEDFRQIIHQVVAVILQESRRYRRCPRKSLI